MFKGVHHIGYLVENLEQSVKMHEQKFAASVERRFKLESSGLDIAFVKVGDVLLELMQPLAGSSRGPVKGTALDHICYNVEDLDKTLADFASRGVPAAGTPNQSSMGGRVVFLDGAALNGARVQLRQP